MMDKFLQWLMRGVLISLILLGIGVIVIVTIWEPIAAGLGGGLIFFSSLIVWAVIRYEDHGW